MPGKDTARKAFSKILLALGLAWCLGLYGAVPLQAGETVLVATGEYPPFFSSKMPGQGLHTRVCREAFALAGVEMQAVFMPWNRAIKEVEKGRFAATMSWIYNPKRDEFAYHSQAMGTSDFTFVYRRSSNFDWRDYQDLKKYPLGATLSYTYPDEFMRLSRDGTLNVEWMSNDIGSLRKLVKGRLAAFPVCRLVAVHLLRRNFSPAEIAELAFHPKPLLKEPVHVLFSKKHPDGERMLNLFNRGLVELKGSGRLAEMEKEYLNGQ